MKQKILILFMAILGYGCKSPTNDNVKKSALVPLWQLETNLVDAPSAPPLLINNSQIIYTGEIDLVSVNADDGKIQWRGEIDNSNALDSKTLLYDGDKIISAHWNSILGWDAMTGKKIIELTDKDGVSVYGLGRNVVIDDGYAFVGDKLDAYVINSDGSIRFTIDVPLGTTGISYYEEEIYLGKTKTISGALTKGQIRVFDSQTGDSLWVFNTEEGGFIWTEPIVEDGIVYAGTYLGNPSRVYAIDAQTGEQIWERAGFSTYKIATSEDRIYVNASGWLYAIEKSNGSIAWRVTYEGSGFGNLLYLQGFVYHVRNTELVVVDDTTGKVVHKEPIPDGTFFWHIAASSDKIFAQTSRQLIAYEPWHVRED